jgi:hypothetical protein
MRSTSRRRFLAAGAGVAASAHFGAEGLFRSALAQAMPPPKRFIQIFVPNSNLRDLWVSTGGRNVDANTGVATTFTLNKHTTPLDPVRQHMTLIHGINLDGVQGDLHSSAQIRCTTGADVRMPHAGAGGGNFPSGPSIDTVIAEESTVVNAAATKLKRIVTIADGRGISLHHSCISSDMMSEFIPPDNAPINVYTQLFSNVVTTGTPMEQQIALQKLRARRQSVLDFLRADLGRIGARVPAVDRPKLDSHLSAIRALEKSFDTQVTPPATTVKLPTGLETLKPDTSSNHPQLIAGFFDIVKAAFQLDLTRVVSFAFGTGNNAVSFADFGGGPSGGVHDIAHLSVNDMTKQMLSTITLWYMGRVAQFIQDLAAISEGTGSLLDNTLVYVFFETAQYHEHNNIPIAIFGGKNLGHVGGRVLSYNNRQVNDVLLSILKTYGSTRTTFGDPRWFKAAAPQIFA